MGRPGLRTRWLSAALLAGAVCAIPAYAAAQDRQEELDGLRGAIDESRERVGTHERKERALLEEIEDLDKKLASLGSQVKRAVGDERHWRSESQRLEKQRGTLETRLAATRSALRTRARALYKSGATGPLQALFVADSVGEWLQRVSSLRTLVSYDRDLVVRMQTERAALAIAQRAALEATQKHDAASRELATSRASLRGQRAKRRKLLAAVSEDRSSERALLVELERAANALEATIAALGRAEIAPNGIAADGFLALRGQLPRPVTAPIGRSFGREVNDQFHTQTFNKGVEFKASAGESVQAAAEGQVRFAGWFRGYGRIVILDHGGGYFTVSGHLDQIAVTVGDNLPAGAVLGTVGDTGSLDGAKLYFEVRRGSQPLDPEEWFASS